MEESISIKCMILFWLELIVLALRAILIARKRCNSYQRSLGLTLGIPKGFVAQIL